MDESFDSGRRGMFVVGGLLGRGAAFFELERKWEKLRKRSDIGIAYFKASDCWFGCGEFAKFVATPRKPTDAERERLNAISLEFVSLIEREMVEIQAIGILQEDFYEVIRDSNARAILGDNPFRLAYDLSMIQCAWVMKQLEPLRDRVCFFCDENEQYSALAHAAYRNLKNTNPEAEKYMATYSEGSDKDFEALQAADACVYEVRRALNIVHRQWPGPAREQFKRLRNAHRMGIIRIANKQNLLNTVALHRLGEPFKLDEIMAEVFHENIHFEI